jgi:hypothetical protein
VDNYDATAIHPVTGELGATMPVRPVLVEKITTPGDTYEGKWRAIYPKDAVPDCDPADPSNNVGGYWLASTMSVTFQASCFSPYYNRTVYSNELSARISIPDYLLGVYTNEYLQKIPFGWKLPTNTDSVASGLNGATFITVNPHQGPYKILDLVNGTTDDDWASSPFNTVGFKFEITE